VTILSMPDRRINLRFRPSDFEKVSADGFAPIADPETRKLFFKKMVESVEIEVHSYCNRTCPFCPNAFIDRRTKTDYLAPYLFTRILQDLKSIDYEQSISFSRYNEPFADPVFFDRLDEARNSLPKARLTANTNGDFLTPDTLEKAYSQGLRGLNIQLYPKTGTAFCLEKIEPLARGMMERASLSSLTLKLHFLDWIEYQGYYRELKIRMYARDFRKNGVNRGALHVTHSPGTRIRNHPCLEPFLHLYIDYNGNVMPCCNLRSDNPKEEGYSLGKLDAEPGRIFEIFSGEKAVLWRKDTILDQPQCHPCRTCHFRT